MALLPLFEHCSWPISSLTCWIQWQKTICFDSGFPIRFQIEPQIKRIELVVLVFISYASHSLSLKSQTQCPSALFKYVEQKKSSWIKWWNSILFVLLNINCFFILIVFAVVINSIIAWRCTCAVYINSLPSFDPRYLRDPIDSIPKSTISIKRTQASVKIDQLYCNRTCKHYKKYTNF